MKKAPNRAEPNGNRREALLRVCARLFREKGFDGTTIRDISDAAGMHSGSPFYHFPNKQEMLLAVMEQGLAEGLRRSEAVLAERLGPEEKFRRLARAGRIAGDAQLARLLVLGAVNWAAQWYRPGGRLSLDEIAAQAARVFLK